MLQVTIVAAELAVQLHYNNYQRCNLTLTRCIYRAIINIITHGCRENHVLTQFIYNTFILAVKQHWFIDLQTRSVSLNVSDLEIQMYIQHVVNMNIWFYKLEKVLFYDGLISE